MPLLNERAGAAGRSTFSTVWTVAGRIDLHAPPAEVVVLRGVLRHAADELPPLLARQFLADDQHRDRPGPAGERRDRLAEELDRLRPHHLVDDVLVDLAGRLGGDDEPGPGLPEFDAVGDVDDAVQHAEAGVAEVVDRGVAG